MLSIFKLNDHLMCTACGKHQQSTIQDEVEICVMHPTLSSNRMIIGSIVAGVAFEHTCTCNLYIVYLLILKITKSKMLLSCFII